MNINKEGGVKHEGEVGHLIFMQYLKDIKTKCQKCEGYSRLCN